MSDKCKTVGEQSLSHGSESTKLEHFLQYFENGIHTLVEEISERPRSNCMVILQAHTQCSAGKQSSEMTRILFVR